ncbi:hypothetical protein CEXT_245061 [Caerostris extrusa]|uniref:Uncharacterized protein n=1 Tax=Caerostris extrusa TaxID=172846 RepID=A0AAV4XCR1_CAEEX|nr:hypothetical protein CEXT_245061 [Caerostris extrusa]
MFPKALPPLFEQLQTTLCRVSLKGVRGFETGIFSGLLSALSGGDILKDARSFGSFRRSAGVLRSPKWVFFYSRKNGNGVVWTHEMKVILMGDGGYYCYFG